MAIANGTCVSFCNQPKAHYLATLRGSRRYVVAFYRCGCWNLTTSRVLRHILASPGYAPGTIVDHVTWIEREFNACQTHCSMYPSIFNRFPVIQVVSLKVRHFSTFWPPLGTPLDNRGKCHRVGKMLVKRLAVYTHLSSTVAEI